MAQKMFFLVVMAVFALLGVGCCPVTPMNISIELDKSFQTKYGMDRKVVVDLVLVGPNEQVRWEGSSMTKYWESGGGMRNTLPTKTLEVNSSKLDPLVFPADDPKWEEFLKDASGSAPPQVYVLVQFPGIFDQGKDDKPGNQDFRRQILPTKKCQYTSNPFGGAPTVKLVINGDRVMTMTTIKPD
jgi:hypothetical protein